MTDVYRNLTRRCWSVRESGRVVAHVDGCAMRDVVFHVSEPIRQRAIRLGQRAVLAFARGVLCDGHRWPSAERIRFNAFEGPDFVTTEGIPVLRAHLAFFDADGSCWCIL